MNVYEKSERFNERSGTKLFCECSQEINVQNCKQDLLKKIKRGFQIFKTHIDFF